MQDWDKNGKEKMFKTKTSLFCVNRNDFAVTVKSRKLITYPLDDYSWGFCSHLPYR